MRRIFTANHLAHAELIAEHLRSEGVDTQIRNQFLGGAAGEIPVFDCQPELWLVDERMAPRAIELINQFESSDQDFPEWSCQQCGEVIDGNYDRCWRCGTDLVE